MSYSWQATSSSRGSFRDLVDNYNTATREHLAGVPFGGPNSLFALVTTRHMRRFGLAREDYGRLVIAQRRSAASNPNAVYRAPLEIEDYLGAEIVADPLCLLDCPPVVSGANGLVLSLSDTGVRIRSIRALHNNDLHESDGTVTGLAELADRLWGEAKAGPAEMDLALVYDDYPVMALAQLTDLGFGTPQETLAAIDAGSLRVNTSGGQLSAGQAGAAGGLHHLVEAVRQLGGTAGDRQVPGAKLAVVTGYGMVAYRYGACANAVVLEAS